MHQSMKSYNSVTPKRRSCYYSLFIVTSFLCGAYFVCSAMLGKDSSLLLPGIGTNASEQCTESAKCKVSTKLNIEVNDTRLSTHSCKDKCRPVGSESLPKGIVSATSNLKMIPLSGPVSDNTKSKKAKSLLAIPIGIKQKRLVNKIVQKFLDDDFVVMLFHYDGIVNQWHDVDWHDNVVHVSATNQTKWWFAKRFLHPDIIAEYEYIFLWDEDLEVENFHPERYISIVKEEGLEISQPALDPAKSKVHHRITVRNRRIRVHRRYYRAGRCDINSTVPPCVGWVEMMAPVFSRAAWRCVWHMIQNDLIHAWGLDMQLGYCAQGDRTLKVGVVDAEYIAHLGLPTLGSQADKNMTSPESDPRSRSSSDTKPEPLANSAPRGFDNRSAIRVRSYAEMRAFTNRWNRAVKEDECWVDPFRRKGTD